MDPSALELLIVLARIAYPRATPAEQRMIDEVLAKAGQQEPSS